MLDQMFKRIYKRVSIISVLILIILSIFTSNYKENIMGYIFGLLVGLLTFRLLVTSSKKSIKMDPVSAERYASKQYFTRFGIYFIVLSIAGLADYLNVLTSFLGLVMVKLVILISTILKWDL